MAEGNSIIVCTDFERVISIASRMPERDSCTIAMVDSFRVNTTGSVSFISAITFQAANLNILAQVNFIDFHSHPRSFNYRVFPKRYPILQMRLLIQELE